MPAFGGKADIYRVRLGQQGRGRLRQPVLLYCVIAVVLNAVLALAWVLWREVAHNHSLAAQVIEIQAQLKKR
jgi:hypothetical protein